MDTKHFMPTPEMVSVATEVLVCMAFEETIREIVEKYQRNILAQMGYEKYDLRHTYLLPKDVFEKYDKRCKEMRDFHKLKVENPDFCPLLVAEHETSKAKRRLIDIMGPVVGITFDDLFHHGMADYDKFVDLTLRLLAPFIGKAA